MDAEDWTIPGLSIADIQTIIEFYCERTPNPDKYVIADLCMCIWYVRISAEKGDILPIVAKTDEIIAHIQGRLGIHWVNVGPIFDLRKDQLIAELDQYEDFVEMWEPRGYLKKLFQETPSSGQDTSPSGSD